MKILITGSLNAKPPDRTMDREDIRPIQIADNKEIFPIHYFNDWGELGVSSLAWKKDIPNKVYLTTGNDLYKIDFETQYIEEIKIPNLKDIHEIDIIDDILWISNSGKDEVIAYDIKKKQILERISLDKYRSRGQTEKTNDQSDFSEKTDTFHCNQIFKGFDNDLYILVHHITGRQYKKKFAEKLLKNQGDGGVCNLKTGKLIPLRLKGPHNVRKIKNEYWILDSGHFSINIYDKDWDLKTIIAIKGWGRGADYSMEHTLFFAAISATRKRYLKVIPKSRQTPNMIEVFSPENKAKVDEFLVPNVEQINNIYLISDLQSRLLQNFK